MITGLVGIMTGRISILILIRVHRIIILNKMGAGIIIDIITNLIGLLKEGMEEKAGMETLQRVDIQGKKDESRERERSRYPKDEYKRRRTDESE